MPTTQKLCFILLVIASVPGCHPPATTATATTATNPLPGKLIDLTHPFNADTIFWPTEKGFLFEPGNNGITEKGYYYAANRFSIAKDLDGDPVLMAPSDFSLNYVLERAPAVKAAEIKEMHKPK